MSWDICGNKGNSGSTPESEFTGVPCNVLLSESNTALTTVTGVPSSFSIASITNEFIAPLPGFDSKFKSKGNNTAELVYDGDDGEIYRIEFSGTITSANPSFLNTYLGVSIISSVTGTSFTGGDKFYPVGVAIGTTPAIGFSVAVYGVFNNGESLSLNLSSNIAGDVLLSDTICFIERIKPYV